MKKCMKIAGIPWSKFMEDKNGNPAILADDIAFTSEFGRNNNFAESAIYQKLKEIEKKIEEELGEDSIIPCKIDLFSIDGFRDYGTLVGKVLIPTFDMYRINRATIKDINKSFYLATPDSTPSGYGSNIVLYVNDGGFGNVRYDICGERKGVRPFFVLRSSVLVSCEGE